MKVKGKAARNGYFRQPDSKLFNQPKSVLLCFFLLAFCLCLAAPVAAQEEAPPNAAPPPVKYLSKDERAALDGEEDLKKRTKLAIELMEARLKKAEALFTENSFNSMFNELGGFHALMDLTLINIRKNNTGSGKVLDTFKRYEMALRSFTPRIEAIRRELPERYEYYVRGLLKNLRDSRSKAIEPFFGQTSLETDGN